MLITFHRPLLCMLSCFDSTRYNDFISNPSMIRNYVRSNSGGGSIYHLVTILKWSLTLCTVVYYLNTTRWGAENVLDWPTSQNLTKWSIIRNYLGIPSWANRKKRLDSRSSACRKTWCLYFRKMYIHSQRSWWWKINYWQFRDQ